MEEIKNNEVRSVKTNNTNKKGLKIALIIIAVILSIFIIMCAIIFMLNKKDLKKLDGIKQSAIQELTLEDKQIEYGTEINVADLKLPEDTKIYINNEEVTDKYKFLDVGTIKVKEVKEINYINFLKKEVTTSIEKDVNIEVVDTKKPVIEGVADKEITQGDSIDLKNGITAKDEVDGALDVTIEGTVDTNTVGEYKITAKATDKNGNTESKDFRVTVKEKEVVTENTTSNNNANNNVVANNKTTTSSSATKKNTTTNNNSTATGTKKNVTTGGSSTTTPKTQTATNTKKYEGPTGKFDQDKPYWCSDGGPHHIHTLGKYDHGWYSTWDEAEKALYKKMDSDYSATGMGSGNYKIDQCNGCNKYYYWWKPYYGVGK